MGVSLSSNILNWPAASGEWADQVGRPFGGVAMATFTLKTPRDIDCSEQDRGALLTGAERGTERNGAEQIRSLTGFMRG